MADQAVLEGPPAETGEASDRELLERYTQLGEERAFRALVERHGPCVRHVCRRVLSHEQDAEDVSQGAFLVLASKAGRIAWQASVRGWLCAVAYRLAINARSATARRRGGEALDDTIPDTAADASDPLAHVARQEVRTALDDELHRLPEKYRAPVLLCYLEGKTNAEAAQALGWPAGSMSRRLNRARALLHERLSQRGIGLGLLLLALGLLSWYSFGSAGLLRPGDDPNTVAHQMRRLAGTPQRQDRAGLRARADQALAVAAALPNHAPRQHRLEWLTFTAEMQRAASDLAQAARGGDEVQLVLASRTLDATCLHCHAVFRR